MSNENETMHDDLPVLDAQIVRYQPTGESLAVVREPEQVLADAQKAASALMKVVSGKKKQITFNGETYLESGDWQTVAKFYGVTAKVESTKFVTFGEASGFEAAAVALDCNGRAVSRGEAMCLNDEENWGTRTKYEWRDVLDSNGKKIWEYNAAKGKDLPKREKVAVGSTPTPLFQLRSMAQTRACGKALSNLFKWVVVLAGYRPTPAEEMTQSSSSTPEYEPDLPSDNLSKPAGASTAIPPTQSPTDQQAASPEPAVSQKPAPQEKFLLDGDLLTCVIRSVTEMKTKTKNTPYLKLIFNGYVACEGGSNNYAFCYDFPLFDALKAADKKECQLKLDTKARFIKVLDVFLVDGVEYINGKSSVDTTTGEVLSERTSQ